MKRIYHRPGRVHVYDLECGRYLFCVQRARGRGRRPLELDLDSLALSDLASFLVDKQLLYSQGGAPVFRITDRFECPSSAQAAACALQRRVIFGHQYTSADLSEFVTGATLSRCSAAARDLEDLGRAIAGDSLLQEPEGGARLEILPLAYKSARVFLRHVRRLPEFEGDSAVIDKPLAEEPS